MLLQGVFIGNNSLLIADIVRQFIKPHLV